VRVRRPRPGPLRRRRDGAGRRDHCRAGGPRRTEQDRRRGRAVRRAPRRPGRHDGAAGRDREVPGRTAGERPVRPGPIHPGPDRPAETTGPGHARGLRGTARPRRGQQVRRRGGARAPAGPRPGLPVARDPPAARRSVRGAPVRPAGTAGRAGGVRGQGAGRTAARRPGRPRTDLRPRAGHGLLGRRAGGRQALAARWAAVRGRGRRPGPLAARRLAARRLAAGTRRPDR